jgi:hypothetical protein
MRHSLCVRKREQLVAQGFSPATKNDVFGSAEGIANHGVITQLDEGQENLMNSLREGPAKAGFLKVRIKPDMWRG